MQIGDLVTYQGKPYYLRGLDPMSVPDRRADLVDPTSGARVSAPLADVRPCSPEEALGPADGGASPQDP